MRAREAKAYYCEGCDFQLRYERRETEFGPRILLWHEPNPGCKFSSKFFYVPRLEITEFPEDQVK